MTLTEAGNLMLYAGTPALLAFIILYSIRSPWRQYQAGRSVMYLALSLVLVLVFAIVSVTLGMDFPFRDWIRLTLYGFVTFSMYRLLFSLIIVQRGSKR